MDTSENKQSPDQSSPVQPEMPTAAAVPAMESTPVSAPAPDPMMPAAQPVSLTPLPETPVTEPVPPTTPPPTDPANQSQAGGDGNKKGGRSSFLVIGGLVVLLVIGLFAAFYYYNIRLQQQTPKQIVAGPTAVPYTPIKTLVIGADATYPPMEFQDDKGTLVGYDIDLGNQIANELGGKAVFRNIAWDDVFQALEQKKVDIIMSSVTITEERKKQYLFSAPYINAGQVILTKKTVTTILSPADLKGKKVGVQKETTSETEAKKYADEKMITSYADYTAAAKDLVSGKIDAVIIDLTAGKGIVDKYPTLKITGDPFTNEYYGVVLRKGDVALQTRINQAISSLHERGVLDNIKQKWFQ